MHDESEIQRYILENDQWTWIAVCDNETCIDCLKRHKKKLSYSEWNQLGVPRAGTTKCNKKCRCVLMHSSYVDDTSDLSKPLYKNKYLIRMGKKAKPKA
jgi:hypothetical protein